MTETTAEAAPNSNGEPSAAFQRALAAYPAEMTRAICELYQPVRNEDELMEILDAAAHLAVQVLPGVEWCSVTTQLDGIPLTTAQTDIRVAELDERQCALKDGPSLHAMRSQQQVSIGAAEVADRWPELAEAVESAGIGSILAAPLSGDPVPRGSLNLYGPGSKPDGVDEHTRDLLLVIEELVNHGLADYAVGHSAEVAVTQLKEGVRNRAVIEQAKGILMAVHRIGAAEAFELLRTQSQHHNVKLRDIAVSFVQTHSAHPVTDVTEKAGTGSFSDFHSAFDHAPIGMAITDLDATLLLANPALAALLHSSTKDLVGTTLDERIDLEQLSAARQALGKLLIGSGILLRQHTRLRCVDGTVVPVFVSAALVHNGDHTPSHLVVHYEPADGVRTPG